jgi:regulator of protease activity HflC (stomatin/prohibitin superfamily)
MSAEAAEDRADNAWAQSLSLSFRFLYLAVAVLGLAWAVSNCRIIPPDGRAVVVRFGQVVREQGAGLLLAAPRPIEQVLPLPAAAQQIQFRINAFQGPGSAEERRAGLAPVGADPRQNTGMLLTGDFSVVHLQASLFYQIDDARAYVLAGPHVAPALERLFIASAVTVCGSRDLDAILVARPELDRSSANRLLRERLRADLLQEVNRRLRDLARQQDGLGITVTRVDLVPSIPTDAKESFDNVLRVIQYAETARAEAQTEAERTAQFAQEQHDLVMANTQAAASERVTEASTRTADINALAADARGLSGVALANKLYRDRIGKILNKAGQVTVVTPNGGRMVIGEAQK